MNIAEKDQLLTALSQYQGEFSLNFSLPQLEKLALYYRTVLKWNRLLHLTTLVSPSDFALRNILESCFALCSLSPDVGNLVDVGSGAGIPGIPLAILCPERSFVLVEAQRRKAIFLQEAISVIGLRNLQVVNQRFELLPPLSLNDCLVSRAIEQFTEKLPALLRFGGYAEQFLFWGSAPLLAAIRGTFPAPWNIHHQLIPTSEERLLISIKRFT